MQIKATPLGGVFRVSSAAHADARGHFARTWCASSFAGAGIDFTPLQSSLSYNTCAHTLRGMHWQAGDAAEQKLVRCVGGRIWDVALDLRAGSPTYLQWFGAYLSADLQGDEAGALFLPRGVAHGFISLQAESVVEYLIDAPYDAQAARGVRWDDAAFGIAWPTRPVVISGRDAGWPDYKLRAHE